MTTKSTHLERIHKQWPLLLPGLLAAPCPSSSRARARRSAAFIRSSASTNSSSESVSSCRGRRKGEVLQSNKSKAQP